MAPSISRSVKSLFRSNVQYIYPALLLFALAIQCSAQAPAERQYEQSLEMASYSGGYVLDWCSPTDTHVSIYGPDTKLAYCSDLRGAHGEFYGGWAIDSDGVAARAYVSHNEGRIDLLDLAGKPILTIRTAFYYPQHLAFAADHTPLDYRL